MNILIYIPHLSQEYGGVRQYSVGLIKILAQDQDNTYFLYHKNSDEEIIKLVKEYPHLKLIGNDAPAPGWLFKTADVIKKGINFLSKRLFFKTRVPADSDVDLLVAKYKIDILHCPYQYIPQTVQVKLITTLHDIQEIHFPEYFSPEERARRANNYLDFLRRADTVIVSYNHVKEDLIKYFMTPPSKIQVILLDMGKLWFEKFAQKDIISSKTLDLPEKFILYPANTWKHKNHIRLLRAIALLRDQHLVNIHLVCTGHLTEHYHQEIVTVYRELNLEDQVKFVGVVSEQQLYSIYMFARGVVVPTVYEAGSFPLMESILMRVPVICSNVTSLPETIADTRFVFDPFNIEEIAKKSRELWESEDFRNLSIENSKKIGDSLVHTSSLQKFKDLYATL